MWRSFSNLKVYTLNFDGSHNNQAGKAGAGCIIRDSQGEFVIAASFNLTDVYENYCDVAITEAVALRNGLRLAKNHNLKIEIIKGDSEEVCNLVVGRPSRRACRSSLGEIIEEIKGMLDPSSKVELIKREANKVADKLAFFGSWLQADSRVYTYGYDLPSQVTEIINQEKSSSSIKESNFDDGEGSSVNDIVKAGVAVAGLAAAAWGFSKLFIGEGSSAQDEVRQMGNVANNNCVTRSRRAKESDFFVLHYQGCDKNQLGKASAGCIIRDKHGQFIVAKAFNLNSEYPDCHIAIAEAIALRNGLQLAKDENIKLNLLLGKNEEVVDRVHGLHKRHPRLCSLDNIIRDIICKLNEQGIDAESQVKLTDKAEDDNEVAYKLAAVGAKLIGPTRTYTNVGQLPYDIAESIERDRMSLDIFG